MGTDPCRENPIDRFAMNQRAYRAVRTARVARTALLAPATVVGILALGPTATLAASTVSPLPASDYTVRSACSTPTPGRAGCLALELVPQTAAARARTHPLGMTRSGPIGAGVAAQGADGLRPADLRDAYFAGESPEAPASASQTIALVDAYNDPNARADLETYEQEFGLSQCPAAESACFEQLNQQGETANPPFPASEAARQAEQAVCENPQKSRQTREAACKQVVEAEGWAVEISTDLDVARAVCQHNCKILLVEAEEPTDGDLEEAESTAVAHGATEISNSWGGEEGVSDSSAFDHPGIPIVAAAGDDGYLNWTKAAEAAEPGGAPGYFVGADYPASSPHVIAVGGTRLTLKAGSWQSESVWNDDPGLPEANNGAGGSGCSSHFEANEWQREVPDWSEVGCADLRAVADVSADSDPYTGVAVYDSVPDVHEEAGQVVNTPLHWWPIGGTSVASPIIASMFALAGGAHGVDYPAQTLYAHLETGLLHPVSAGGNGQCDDSYAGCAGSMNPLSSRFAFDCGEGVLICNSAPGCEGHYYDGPTGVGTPDGIAAFKPEEHPARDVAACQPKSKSSSGSVGGKDTGESSGSDPTMGPPPVAPERLALALEAAPSAAAAAARVPTLSALTLTANALVALNRHRPKVSWIAFAFRLDMPARVHAKLAKQVKTGGRTRWQILPFSRTITAAKGRDSAHLSAQGALVPGRYRLTLTPAHGTARSLTFQVG
jgi:Subtilase family